MLLGVAACVVLVLVLTWASVPVVVFTAVGRQRLVTCALEQIGTTTDNVQWGDLDPLIARRLRRLISQRDRANRSTYGYGLARLLLVMQGVDRRPTDLQMLAFSEAVDMRVALRTHRLQQQMSDDDLVQLVASAGRRIYRLRVGLAIEGITRYGLRSGRYALNEIGRDATALAVLAIIASVPLMAVTSLAALAPVDAWVWLANAASGGTLIGVGLGIVELILSIRFVMRSGQLAGVEIAGIRSLCATALAGLLLLICLVVAAAYRSQISSSLLAIPAAEQQPSSEVTPKPLSPLTVVLLVAVLAAIWLGIGWMLRHSFRKRAGTDPIKQVLLWTGLVLWIDMPIVLVTAVAGGAGPDPNPVLKWALFASGIVLLLVPFLVPIAAIAATAAVWFRSRRPGNQPKYLSNLQIGLLWIVLFFIIGWILTLGVILAVGWVSDWTAEPETSLPWMLVAFVSSIAFSLFGFLWHRARNARLRTNQQLHLRLQAVVDQTHAGS